GELLVRYLGVPLVSTKLGQKDCKALFDLIMHRVKTWASNYLSFGGRLQLILATLASIQVFWCRTFILPVSMVKLCERMLRSFLWYGVGDAKRAGKVAWAKVCHPNEGGLGIKSMWTWNKAAILQLVNITVASSWSWRNVLKLRECLARNLVYSIRDGRATSLWWDPWINGEALITKNGARVPIDADILMHAKVSAVIVNRQWAWPLNSWVLREIDTLVQQKCIEQGPDVIHWLSKGKPFSCKAAWQVMRHILLKVAWADIVWFSNCIPKHSFCLWLTFHNAHRTTDKLRSYGVVEANQCMFGYGGLESIDHIFFGCKFTAEI
ncbi:LOW QUALITY PROTEIN: zf-RVT domain-containing protein, partial [Cephalotus follicularis]